MSQNVSPAAHAVLRVVVIDCGTGFYGIVPRDTVSLVSYEPTTSTPVPTVIILSTGTCATRN